MPGSVAPQHAFLATDSSLPAPRPAFPATLSLVDVQRRAMNRRPLLAVLVSTLAACGDTTPPPAVAPAPPPTVGDAPPPAPTAVVRVPTPPPGPATLTSKALPLPGVTGPAFLDYIAYEPAHSRVWVPVGSTGSVDVLDVTSNTFTRVDGFKTVEREMNGKKRTLGPSAASVGDGFVYVGNRASNEVCPVDVNTLRPAKCLKLGTGTDGVAYVASAREVWVTTPKDETLTVLDASKPSALAVKTTVKTDGAPEGYAVDEAHGLFFTNLEDKGGTVVVDVKTHQVKTTWSAGCGTDGPRGIAFDSKDNVIIVACTDHVQVLDAAHEGALLGRLDVGAGVDNIDCVGGKLYVAAGKAAKLTVASINDKGQLTVVASGDSSDGARNAVADANGNTYVADSLGARLLVFPAAKPQL
jgi:DNA-binding beta-propeller fold protein YncE